MIYWLIVLSDVATQLLSLKFPRSLPSFKFIRLPQLETVKVQSVLVIVQLPEARPITWIGLINLENLLPH